MRGMHDHSRKKSGTRDRLGKIKILSKIAAIIVGLAVIAMLGVFARSFAAPGTSVDPVVTLSYIEKQLLPSIYSYIDDKFYSYTQDGGIEAIQSTQQAVDETQNADDTQNAQYTQPEQHNGSFVLVSLEQGHSLICDAGAEMVLRMGKAVVVATARGGLADVTAAVDLPDGEIVPSNSLLIVPYGDGRGITATSDALVLVKGGYTIK